MSKQSLWGAFALVVPLYLTTSEAAQSQSVAVDGEGQKAVHVELPEVLVTSPSPIAKPSIDPQKKFKPKPQPVVDAEPGPPNSAVEAQPPQGEAATDMSTAASVPGTLLVVEDAFATVTVTTAREIESTQGQTITDTLAHKPGIAGSAFAAGASRPIIRGLDNNRVRIQEDGIGAHDVSALSEDHAVPIDPNSADRVEVVRGPATLRYGGQAIGGVVSVENGRIPSFMPPNGFSGQIQGGYSSVDDGRDGALKATAGVNGIVVHADAFRRKADDYDTPLGKQANTFVDSEGFSFGSSRVGSDGFAGVAFTHFESLYGIPASEENTRIDMEQSKILSKGEWRVRSNGIDAVRYWFGASDYAHNEVLGDGEIGSRFTNKEQEGRIELQHSPFLTRFGQLTGAAGIQVNHRDVAGLSFESGENLLEPATTSSIAGFLFEELQVTRPLRLQAAARIEQTHVKGVGVEDPFGVPTITGRERSFTPFGGSLGALYDLPSGVVARISGQYVERAPDAAELFSKGAHEATETFEIGNPDLGKEKAKTVEVGLRRAGGGLRFDATAFYTKFDGFIFKQLTGETCGPTLSSCGVETELNELVFQARDATFYGVELAAQYDVAPIWNGLWGIEGQYDMVRAQLNGGENVPRIPPQRLGGGLYYRDAAWFARLGVLHAFDQSRVGDYETPTPGYTLVSAELSYTRKFGRPVDLATEYTVGIKGQNLADDEVRNHASFKKNDVLEPGASVRVFGNLKFN